MDLRNRTLFRNKTFLQVVAVEGSVLNAQQNIDQCHQLKQQLLEHMSLQMSSNVLLKESSIAGNNRKDAYVLSNGNVYTKFSSNKSTSADVEKNCLVFQNIVLNISTAGLKSSSDT